MKPMPIPDIAREHHMIHLVFEDDFDSLDTIDVNNTCQPGYKWYITRPYCGEVLEPDDYKVENSVLTLCNKVPTYNYGMCSMDPGTLNGFAFHQGVLEFRMRIPRPRKNVEGEKGIPAIWSFPPEKLNSTTRDFAEADWMEYWGDGFYSTTFHHMKLDPAQKPELTYWACNPNNAGPFAFTDEQWHTMTFLWVDGAITSWVDGVPAVSQTYYEGQHPNPMPYIHKGYTKDAYKILNENSEALILGGSADNPLEIDWIRVWQA